MAIKIITDSTCDLDVETIEKYDINVVPLYIHFGLKSYRENIDLKLDDFYVRSPDEEYPLTSQPSIHDFLEVYEKFIEEGHSIISIHISSKVSGTFNSATTSMDMLKDNYPDADITVIDSQAVSSGLGLNVIRASEMVKEGKSKEEICEELVRISSRNHLVLQVFDLSFMVKDGKVGKDRAAMAKLLSIFPLFTLNYGYINHYASPAGKKASLRELFEYFRKETKINPPELISTVCGIVPEEEEKLYNLIRKEYPETRVYRNRLGAVIGAHMGLKTSGVVWF